MKILALLLLSVNAWAVTASDVKQWEDSGELEPIMPRKIQRPLSRALQNNRHVIQRAESDTAFLIGGVVFTSNMPCMGFNVGDVVVFVEGGLINCTRAQVVHTRSGERCKLHC